MQGDYVKGKCSAFHDKQSSYGGLSSRRIRISGNFNWGWFQWQQEHDDDFKDYKNMMMISKTTRTWWWFQWQQEHDDDFNDSKNMIIFKQESNPVKSWDSPVYLSNVLIK